MLKKFEAIQEFKPEDERPILPGEQGSYTTETFNQWVYDPIEDIGLNIWFASGTGGGGKSWPNFMSTVIIFLKGEVFVARGDGTGNHAEGVAAGNAFLTLHEPYKKWSIDYLGLLSKSAGPQSLFTEASAERYLGKITLDVDILSPPIEQGSQGDRGAEASAGTKPRTALRYEQLARISGLLQIGSRSFQVNALGMRSHRRNSASIYDSGAVGHTWATGLFPSGRGFHLLSYQVEPEAKVGFLYGHYFDGKEYHEAEVLDFPIYSAVTEQEKSRLLMRAGGKEIEVQVISYPPLVSQIPPQDIGLTRSPARFILDGEIGGGVLERSLAPRFAAGGTYPAVYK